MSFSPDFTSLKRLSHSPSIRYLKRFGQVTIRLHIVTYVKAIDFSETNPITNDLGFKGDTPIDKTVAGPTWWPRHGLNNPRSLLVSAAGCQT
jgi:hypothetical protein